MGKVLDVLISPLTLVDKKLGKAIESIGLIAYGAATGNFGLISAGLAMGASLLAPKSKAPAASAANASRLNASIDLRTGRKIVFGRTAMNVDLRDQEWSADQVYLHRFFVVASHKCQAIEEIWFDDKQAWTAAGGVTAAFSGYLTITTVLEGSAANAINIGARMGSSRRYTGCAYVYCRFKVTGNSSKTDSPFAQSVPTRITIVGKGAALYDPRRDSTVAGGSGSQRANDQTTWAWDDAACRNPALQELWYELGWRIQNPATGAWKLAVGKGIPPARVNLASYIEAANLCDETVAIAAGGTEPRYRSDGVFSETDDPGTVRDNLKAACNATLDDVDGKIRITVLHNDLASPIGSLGTDDVLGAFTWTQTPPLDQTVNIIRGGYTDPSTTSLYQLADYPEVSYVSPDGIDRPQTVNFPLVQSASQAQRLAKLRLQRGVFGGVFEAVFQATAWRFQKGDVIQFTFAPLGWTNKLFRIAEMAIQVDGTVPMVLREEDPALYPATATDAAPIVGVNPTTYNPATGPIAAAIADAGTTASWPAITGTGKPADNATVGAVAGTNLKDSSGAVLGDGAIKNSAVTINPDGTLAGAGGGQVTAPGLGVAAGATADVKWSLVGSTSGIALVGNTMTKTGATAFNVVAVAPGQTGPMFMSSMFDPAANTTQFICVGPTNSNVGLGESDLTYLLSVSASSVNLYDAHSSSYVKTQSISITVPTEVKLAWDGVNVQVEIAGSVVMTYTPAVPFPATVYPKVFAYTAGATYNMRYGSYPDARGGPGLYALYAGTDTYVTIANNVVTNVRSDGFLAVAVSPRVAGPVIIEATIIPGASYSILTLGADGTALASNVAAYVQYKADTGAWGIFSYDTVVASGITATGLTGKIRLQWDGVKYRLAIGASGEVGSFTPTTVLTSHFPKFVAYGFGTSLRDCRVTPTTSQNFADQGGATKPEDNATVGARAGTNLKDGSGSILVDSAVKNSAISMNPDGTLAGAGGGGVQYDSLPDGTSYKKYLPTERTKLTGIETGATLGASWNYNLAGRPANLSALSGSEGIQNSGITYNADGTLSGAGGGTAPNLSNIAGSIDPSTSKFKAIGSIPPSIPDNSFTYTSTTSSITISWPSMTIYRADGTTFTIASGSLAITGLSATTTYSLFPYCADSGGASSTVAFVTGGSGSPSSAFTSGYAAAAAVQYSRGNVPLGSFPASTTASGSGGGGGGGSACLHPSVPMGDILADDLETDSLVATPTGDRPIRQLRRILCSRWIVVTLDNGEALPFTPTHRLYRATGEEVHAEHLRLGDLLDADGRYFEVTGLGLDYTPAYCVSIEIDDPHEYFAGWSRLRCHNLKPRNY